MRPLLVCGPSGVGKGLHYPVVDVYYSDLVFSSVVTVLSIEVEWLITLKLPEYLIFFHLLDIYVV